MRATGQITIEEFDAMDLPDSCEWELVDGTVVSLTLPTGKHGDIEDRLVEILKALFKKSAVRSEYGYVLKGNRKHRADVAVVDPERHRKCRDSNLQGSPELVVEVMSRSNLPYRIDELERRCLSEGAQYFWRVNFLTEKSIQVGRLVGENILHETYETNDLVPVRLFGVEAKVSVNDIFGVLD